MEDVYYLILLFLFGIPFVLLWIGVVRALWRWIRRK